MRNNFHPILYIFPTPKSGKGVNSSHAHVQFPPVRAIAKPSTTKFGARLLDVCESRASLCTGGSPSRFVAIISAVACTASARRRRTGTRTPSPPLSQSRRPRTSRPRGSCSLAACIREGGRPCMPPTPHAQLAAVGEGGWGSSRRRLCLPPAAAAAAR